jgi:hypothetical protein
LDDAGDDGVPSEGAIGGIQDPYAPTAEPPELGLSKSTPAATAPRSGARPRALPAPHPPQRP